MYKCEFTESRQRTEDTGAIAVVVAILSTLLLLMAAFAVDLGNAYAVKRQLSVAADAAALDAARAVAVADSAGQPIEWPTWLNALESHADL